MAVLLGAARPGFGTEFLIETWLTDQGLPQNSITAVAQTADGYLWVGTRNAGLARYDGVRFTGYSPLDTPVLQSFEISRLGVTNEGALIITAGDGSLTHYENGTFRRMVRHPRTPSREWLWAAMPVAASDELGTTFQDSARRPLWPGTGGPWEVDREGGLWFRTEEGELARSENGRVEIISLSGVPGERAQCVAMDADGRIWVGTDGGIGVWDGTRLVDRTPPDGPARLSVRGMAFSGDGGLWLDAGDRLLKVKDGRRLVESPYPSDDFNGSVYRRWLHGDADGGVWLTHYLGGVFHVDSEGNGGRIRSRDGGFMRHVNAWYQDRERNIWIGLEDRGLLRLRKPVFELIEDPSRGYYSATSVCQDNDGDWWIGSGDGTLMRRRNGKLEDVAKLQTGAVVVYPRREGGIWGGSATGGLFRVEGGRLKRMGASSGPDPAIRSLLEDGSGRLWIGGNNGLFRWQDGDFLRIDGVPAHSGVLALAEGPDGTIWFGSADSRLGRVIGNEVELFEADERDPLTRFWSVMAASDGTVWIGTLGGGLLRFRDNRFTRFTSDDGLPVDTICQVLEDGLGWLWLGTRSGIIRVKKDTLEMRARDRRTQLRWLAYGREDGLMGQEVASGTHPGAWAGRNGRLWFAANRGAVAVNPAEVEVEPVPPLTRIEQVSLDGYSRRIRHLVTNGEVREELPGMEILSGQRHMEIRYTGLSFVAVDQMRFRYMLEGLNEDWVDAGSRRVASFHNLPSGDYVFRVQACNRGGGIWSGRDAALTITVLPYFWQTWWFRAGISALILAMVAATVHLRERRRARRKLEALERERAVENERARIARDIHDDLGASLTRIVALSDSASEDLDDRFRTAASLDRIHSTACDLTDSLSEIVWAVSPSHDHLDSLVDYIEALAQESLTNAGISCRFAIPSRCPPIPLGAQVRHNVYLAFKEALHNVVKHSGATEVRIALSLSPDGFTLSIEDNGRKASAEMLAAGSRSSPRAKGGHGLPNMHARLRLIGGRCNIRQGATAGVRVEFFIPTGAALSDQRPGVEHPSAGRASLT